MDDLIAITQHALAGVGPSNVKWGVHDFCINLGQLFALEGGPIGCVVFVVLLFAADLCKGVPAACLNKWKALDR